MESGSDAAVGKSVLNGGANKADALQQDAVAGIAATKEQEGTAGEANNQRDSTDAAENKPAQDADGKLDLN